MRQTIRIIVEWAWPWARVYGPALILGLILCTGCATTQYSPLASADRDQVQQLKENVFRVEYRVSPFTPQERLDDYLRRRCAELTLSKGYDYFQLSQRTDVLALSRRSSMTVTMFQGQKPTSATELYDARALLAAARATVPKAD